MKITTAWTDGVRSRTRWEDNQGRIWEIADAEERGGITVRLIGGVFKDDRTAIHVSPVSPDYIHLRAVES